MSDNTDEQQTTDEQTTDEQTQHEQADDTTATDEPVDHDEPQGDTFSRDYVQRLRGEAARHRREKQETHERADALSRQLWTARVEQDGRLADATDLPYDPDMLTDGAPDPEQLAEAVDDLLARKPHLAKRKATGGFGQGDPNRDDPASLAGILRHGAQ